MDQSQSEAPAEKDIVEQPQEEQQICRLCWGEADSSPGGQLVSPCSCCGTSAHIHLRCLCAWQQSLCFQGQFKRSRSCEVCRKKYSLGLHNTGFFRMLHMQVLEALHCASYPVLLYRWGGVGWVDACLRIHSFSGCRLAAGLWVQLRVSFQLCTTGTDCCSTAYITTGYAN